MIMSLDVVKSWPWIGIELNRHQVTNLINAGFSTVQPIQQQQQHQLVAQAKSEPGNNRKGRGNNQHNQQQQQQNQQQQQQMLQQQMGTQLMAVAFPGQHSGGSGQQQQQLGHQQQHQLIAPSNRGSNVTYTVSNSGTVWACPACKSSFKSAAELQTHLR